LAAVTALGVSTSKEKIRNGSWKALMIPITGLVLRKTLVLGMSNTFGFAAKSSTDFYFSNFMATEEPQNTDDYFGKGLFIAHVHSHIHKDLIS
jgi:hypothetical protein